MRVTCFFDDLSSSSVPWYVFGKTSTEGIFFSFMVSLFVLFVLTNEAFIFVEYSVGFSERMVLLLRHIVSYKQRKAGVDVLA